MTKSIEERWLDATKKEEKLRQQMIKHAKSLSRKLGLSPALTIGKTPIQVYYFIKGVQLK